MAGIPVLVAVSAPTALADRVGRGVDITLIDLVATTASRFLRNAYRSKEERIARAGTHVDA